MSNALNNLPPGTTPQMVDDAMGGPDEVLTPNVMVKIDGKTFRCECGANVFHKDEDGLYVCNGCSLVYEGK